MLGIILSVFASILIGTSATMQKYSLRRIRKFRLKKIFSNRLWILSVIIGGVGTLMYLFAMRLSPIHIVQPIIAVSMLIPVIFGSILFGEKIGNRWFHIIIIFIGVWLLSL